MRGSGSPRVGVWIVGALGDVATTAMVGAFALARGLRPPTGLVTARGPAVELPLVAPGELVFGGHDVREDSPRAAAIALDRALGCFGPELLDGVGVDLDAVADRLRPGMAFGCSDRLAAELPKALQRETRSEAVARIGADLRAFAAETGVERVVVVHLTSTEPTMTATQPVESLEAFEAALVANSNELPASVLYAAAAFREGFDFVNFTPCPGSAVPAMVELATSRGCCHAGRDGKTGETLVRTVLAPMFLERHLRVLSWSGFNLLGNRDGEVLADPGANLAKTRGKDAVMRDILGELLGESLTRIDYVKSLGDRKTAWDFVHFEGFLGTPMSLQFTWQGADSALAAPLVLDLVRLVELARRKGRRGVIGELACFFKDPLGWPEKAFSRQVARYEDFLAELSAEPGTDDDGSAAAAGQS